MTVLTRTAAVMTVLFSLAVMAVSAYAAVNEVPPPDANAPAGAALPPADWAGDAPAQSSVDLPSDLPPEIALLLGVPAPPPAPEIRYAAPEEAGGVGPRSGGRSNLSPASRVWPVISLKPGAPNLAALAQGGFEIPLDQLVVMQQVSLQTGIPWQIFGAIAKVESDLGRNMATSSAGAIGYGQFLPISWAVYGGGGDPYDFRDAIPAMGRFLLDAGAPDELASALYMYNHSWSYVATVLSYAASYGYPGVGAGPGQSDQLIWPAVGPISSYFGPSHPLGIDIDQTMVPGALVRAAHDGAVLFAGGDRCCSYGLYVILAGPSGLTTLYGHFDALAVLSGQWVQQGDVLGAAGCTGYCTGTHLHFEVLDQGVRRDPLDYLP